jgi:hypothetical protein
MNQGTVFYMTELLAQIEGLERGPAGNTALSAAFKLAQEMDQDQIIVVQETEYTGAGKHILPQLTFAKENGIELLIGDPTEEIPGKNIILPKDPSYVKVKELDVDKLKLSLIKHCISNSNVTKVNKDDVAFLIAETKSDEEFVKKALEDLNVSIVE